MPINSFNGYTLVCFIDISGFKRMMRKRENAFHALESFYQTGYDILRLHSQHHLGNEPNVEGIFISDCAVLFVRHQNSSLSAILRPMLEIVERLNTEMINRDVLLTTSIAYGYFSYEPRHEFIGIEKNIVFGAPYLEAYLDNSVGQPKLVPGLCRILVGNLPVRELNNLLKKKDPFFQRLAKHNGSEDHLYFYWMLNEKAQIREFHIALERPHKIAQCTHNYNHLRHILKSARAT